MSEGPLTDAELDSAIEDCFYLSPTDIQHRVRKLVIEIRSLRAEKAEMREAIRSRKETVDRLLAELDASRGNLAAIEEASEIENGWGPRQKKDGS